MTKILKARRLPVTISRALASDPSWYQVNYPCTWNPNGLPMTGRYGGPFRWASRPAVENIAWARFISKKAAR